MVRRRFVLGALMLALFALGWWVGRGSTSDLYANLDVFVEVLQRVEENYVTPVQPDSAVHGAIVGMLEQLDPYSEYLDARDYRGLEDMTAGHYGGIGAVVGVRDGFPTVISPVEGGPAWRAGIHSGDVIVKIDGRSAAGVSVPEAARLLRGKDGTTVTITVRREGEDQASDYTLTRREVVTKSVPYAFVVGKDLGYVRLANFSQTSGAEVRAAVEELRARGARRFVIDLRMNPGGLLDQAVGVAEQFLPKGSLVVSTRGRARNQDQRFYASRSGADLRSPLVVLVDEGSASASEIVAGALQDLDRALIVGRTSFGKGSVQSLFPLHGGATALKLTTALYYTPSGRSIHKQRPHGFDPESDDDESAADTSADSLKAKPRFHTSHGRTVYGGGGITPDVVVVADTLAAAAREVERRGLAFRFANRWENQHPGATVPAAVPESMWREFVAFVGEEKPPLAADRLAAERPAIERGIRRELARRVGGDGAAMRVALESDPVFARAALVLGHAAQPMDVFASTVRDRSQDPTR